MLAVGCAVVLAAGCMRPSAVGESERLVATTSTGLAIVEPDAGRVAFSTSAAVPNVDLSKIYATGDSGVSVLDGTSGKQEGLLSGAQDLVPTVVSTSGRRLALSEARGTRVGRAKTRIAIVDTSGETQPRNLTLDGNFEPEAFSSDDRNLFVLQYVPPEAPEAYRVRQVNLATGTVQPLVDRWKHVPLPQNTEESMRGTGRQQVLSPDRQTLYTLYTHQPDHLHGRDLAAGLTTARGDVHAFVHTLKLNEGWAYCVDLPLPFGLGPATAHAIAVSPDGSRVVVIDRSSGAMASIDTESLEIRQNVPGQADPRADLGSAAAVFSPDGRSVYVSGGSELLKLDARSLAVTGHWPVAGATSGLAVSADGTRLYLGSSARVAVLDAATAQALGSVEVPDMVSIRS